jgi:hypothetical protein
MMQLGLHLRAALLEGVMANLNSVFAQAAADHAERPAVRMDDLVLSYAELRDAAGRVTSLLSSAGLAPGDRVAVMLPNVPAFPIVFYGALGAGGMVVPMNPLLKHREVAYYLGDSGAKVLFAWHAAAGDAGKGVAGRVRRSSRSTRPCGLLYTNAVSIDLARHHPDPAEREARRELADLLTPISKAWCTDLGVELTSTGLQVNGGTGYVEETGVAQHWRDSRIAPIYEGTNGIQAIDLVIRKVPTRGGGAVSDLLAQMEALDRELAGMRSPRWPAG